MALLFLEGEHIVASSIHMNDYHLLKDISLSDFPYDQYNFCHQLGHAFGLTHSQGTNSNMNCMATARFTDTISSDLQHPDSSNLDNLVELYGERSRKLEASPIGLRGSHQRQEEEEGRILALGNGIRVTIHKF
jgi:hypothetical protein